MVSARIYDEGAAIPFDDFLFVAVFEYEMLFRLEDLY